MFFVVFSAWVCPFVTSCVPCKGNVELHETTGLNKSDFQWTFFTIRPIYVLISLTSCDPWRKCVLSYFLYLYFSADHRYLNLQLQRSGVCSPSQETQQQAELQSEDDQQWRGECERDVSSGWKCNNRKLQNRQKNSRERFFFFKSKIRACGGGRYGRADMIQRGQRDVRYFLKKWTFNDPLGDSVRPPA